MQREWKREARRRKGTGTLSKASGNSSLHSLGQYSRAQHKKHPPPKGVHMPDSAQDALTRKAEGCFGLLGCLLGFFGGFFEVSSPDAIDAA